MNQAVLQEAVKMSAAYISNHHKNSTEFDRGIAADAYGHGFYEGKTHPGFTADTAAGRYLNQYLRFGAMFDQMLAHLSFKRGFHDSRSKNS